MTKLFRSFAVLAAAAALAGGCAAKGPVRVTAVEKVALAPVEGDPAAIRITATGNVPTEGWSGALLRPLHEPTFPPGVAAFELVAAPPEPGTRVALGARRMTAAAIATLPPGTRWVNVLAAVNDETTDVPGAEVVRVRKRTRHYDRIYVRAGDD